MLTGKTVQKIADTAGTGAQPGATYQLGPDVGASMLVEITATATLTLEGRMGQDTPWVAVATAPAIVNAQGQYSLARMMPEVRVNISANTGTVRVWLMA